MSAIAVGPYEVISGVPCSRMRQPLMRCTPGFLACESALGFGSSLG
jgi:hypothetical protein